MRATFGTGPQVSRTWLAVVVIVTVCAAPLGADERRRGMANVDETALITLEQTFAAVLQDVEPSVVSLRVRREAEARLDVDGKSGLLRQAVMVNGSGTIIRRDGLILTNEHVVRDATRVDVTLHDGRVFPGTVVGTDARADLAVLRIQSRDLVAAQIAKTDQLARGQWTLAVGNPFGLAEDGRFSVSTGVIANLGRRLPGLGEKDDRFYHNMIQTTAVINPGNSGGPLFNLRGELIGVVTAMHTRLGTDEGAGFAVPLSSRKRKIVRMLAAGQSIEYGYIGLAVQEKDPGRKRGVAVVSVESDGPAERAGIRAGDVVTAIESTPVVDPPQLAGMVGETPVGDTIRLSIRRAGRDRVVPVVADRRTPKRVSLLRDGAARGD